MKKFQILGLKSDVDLITEEIMKNSQMELLKNEKYNTRFKNDQIENSYKSYFNRLNKIMDSLKLDKKIKEFNFDQLNKLSLEELED
ncbi:MAG: hypothetical protein AWL62_2828, partial [Halanaerobium sp. T82-1]